MSTQIIYISPSVLPKVTPKEYLEFFTAYYAKKFPNQRFGQAFLNHFMPDVQCQDLFYQENDSLADAYIWKNFLQLED